MKTNNALIAPQPSAVLKAGGGCVQRLVRRFDFTPRPPGRSFAGRGGLKDWPDEWRCKTCAWCGTKNPTATRIYCRAWNRAMWANSDRACYEEPLEMLRERKAYERDLLIFDIRDDHDDQYVAELMTPNTELRHGAIKPPMYEE